MTDIDAIAAEPANNTFVVWFDANHDPYLTFYRDDAHADGDARWVNADLYDTGSEDDAPKTWAALCEMGEDMDGPHTLVPNELAAERDALTKCVADLTEQLATAQQDIRDRYEQIARLERHIAGLETQCNEQMHALTAERAGCPVCKTEKPAVTA